MDQMRRGFSGDGPGKQPLQPSPEVQGQAQQGGNEKDGEDGGDQQSSHHHAAEAAVELAAGARRQHQRSHAENGGDGAHVDGADAGADGLGDGLARGHFLVSHVVQALVNDEDGVVDHDAHQNHKSEHSDDVQRLGHHEPIDQKQPDKPPSRGQGNREHDDDRVEKVFEQGRHEQKADHDGQHEIPLQGNPRAGQVIGRSAHFDGIQLGQPPRRP